MLDRPSNDGETENRRSPPDVADGGAFKRCFDELLASHGAALKGMLLRLTRNSHDADEVFQETAMRVWKNIQQLPRVRHQRAWLMTIGYRVFLDSRLRRDSPATLSDQADDQQLGPAQIAQQAETRQRVNELIDTLPDAGREVVLLHYSGGLSLRETAAAIGIPVGTVKSRLNQALALLRKKL